MPSIGPIELLVLLVIVLGTAFWIWMIIECATKERDTDRLVWIVIIAFTHFIGAAIYFVVQRPRRIAHSGPSSG